MPLNIDREKLNLNKNVIRGVNTTWLQQDVLVPDTKPDVMKIIKVDANTYITNSEIMDNTIRLSLQVSYYIIYLSDTGEIRSINVNYPYIKVIEEKNLSPNMSIRITPTVRNIIYSLPNERKIAIKTEVMFRYKLTEVGNIEILNKLTECKGLECKMTQGTFFNVMEQKKDIIEVKEDIVVPESIPEMREILRISNDIVNTEYKVSYNKILVKGEIKTDIVYVDNTENKEIGRYAVNIPFTGMVEFSNISDSSEFDIEYSLRSFDVFLDNMSENNNMISINAEVETDISMYERKDMDYIDDFYSTNAELTYNKEEVNIIKNIEKIEKSIVLKENVGTVEEDTKILDYEVDVSNLTTKISGGTVYISGSVKLSVMYRLGESNKVENKIYDILVDTNVPLSKDIDEKFVNVNIHISKEMVRVNGTNIESDIELLAVVSVDNVEKVAQIDGITENDFPGNELNSMNMYIVKKGDTLWLIAKKYKTNVSNIVNTNNLVDENKLDIGQKILIIR